MQWLMANVNVKSLFLNIYFSGGGAKLSISSLQFRFISNLEWAILMLVQNGNWNMVNVVGYEKPWNKK